MSAKVVVVTQRTRLDGLLERFNTLAQARFHVEGRGLDFSDYEAEHGAYRGAVEDVLRDAAGVLPRVQALDRELLPNFLFDPEDVVVTVGRDGLVVNAAKYVGGRPIVAVNPEPSRWDGVLAPFAPCQARPALQALLRGRAKVREVTLAEARLADGQRLLAFNDLLVGQRTHVSARYRLTYRGRQEEQSSSGVLVSTGAGSTGWLSSVLNMSAVAARLRGEESSACGPLHMAWDDPRLAFAVREPFASRSSGTELCAGLLAEGESLLLESHMAGGGVIFSDGVESDALSFDAGAVATLRRAEERARLVAAW
jgi:hypothetical protein